MIFNLFISIFVFIIRQENNKTNMKIMQKLHHSFLFCLKRVVLNFKSQQRRKKKSLKFNTGCRTILSDDIFAADFYQLMCMSMGLIHTRMGKSCDSQVLRGKSMKERSYIM